MWLPAVTKLEISLPHPPQTPKTTDFISQLLSYPWYCAVLFVRANQQANGVVGASLSRLPRQRRQQPAASGLRQPSTSQWGYTAGYGSGASTGAPGSAGYPLYGAPPPNVGYAYGGAPPGTPGYNMGTPGIGYSMDALGNIDVPMSVPGDQAYGYGAPNPVGNIGGGAPGGYAVGGAPGAYPVGAAPPGYPAYAPPPGAAGYPYGAPSLGAAYPAAVCPAAGGGGGAPGDCMGFKGGQPPSQQPVDPRNQIQTGRWAAGLCACCDDCVPNLWMPWCCPCVSLAQIYARMGMQGYKPAVARSFLLYVVGFVGNFVPYTRASRSSSSTSGGLYYSNGQHYTTGSTDASTTMSSMATLILTVMLLAGQTIFRAHIWHVRSKVRERFHIPGGDCCASCFCSCCAIAQLATHVKSYTPGSCGFGGPDVLPAYTR